MIDLRELLELLEKAEEEISDSAPIPFGLDKAINMLHKEIQGQDK